MDIYAQLRRRLRCSQHSKPRPKRRQRPHRWLTKQESWSQTGDQGMARCLKRWWPGTESNRRRQPFQGCALPAELPGHVHSEGATQVFFRGPQQARSLGWRTHRRECSALRNIRIIAALHASAKFLTTCAQQAPGRVRAAALSLAGACCTQKNRGISPRPYALTTFYYFSPPTAFWVVFFCSH
jgi:hypothetical protein